MRNAILIVILLAFGRAWPIAAARDAAPTTSEADALGGIIELTSGFERAGEAYFSPDMGWIIFQGVPAGQQHYQMYVARLKRNPSGDISGIEPPVRISPENSRNTCGYFAPDGRSLIFASTAGKERPEEPASGYQRQGHDYRWSFPEGMEIYRADDWQAAIAGASGPEQIVDLARRRLTDNDAYDAEGSYSPDGKWIVFTSKRTGDLELFAMRPDGSKPVQVTHAPGYDGGPFVSPDGKRIIYRSDRKNNNLLQIYAADLTFDAAGDITGIANERQVTNDRNVNWGPWWHPDGEHIIYASSAQGHTNYELYLVRADGSHLMRITFTDGADVLPVLSPDGRYLLWSSKRGGSTQVYLAHFRLPAGS